VLEAAHILPFAERGPHEISNGLLLRSDFHKLFDIGLVTVTPSHHIEVSSRIKEEWFNGMAYYRLHGKTLASIPDKDSDKPSAAMLQWPNEHRFRA
jgi:putative restriction endonuclease